jgi:hypothetical protein
LRQEKYIMKKQIQKVGVSAILALSFSAVTPAFATSTGGQWLGFPANSIEVWRFSCPAGSNGAVARVSDTAPVRPALMQVVLSKDSIPTIQRTAPNEGQSTFATVNDGSGSYTVAFKKTGFGWERYIGHVFCSKPTSGGFPLLVDVGGLQKVINQ